MKEQITKEKARILFKENGGILRTGEAIKLGINPKTLYQLRKDGEIKTIDRGIYLLVDDEIDIENIDIITTHKRLPKGVICLISALAFHNLTTQIPHYVYIAYQQGWRQPKLQYPPTQIFRYSEASFEAGVEYHTINGLKIPIYSAAKTVVDCFKFRNRIGLDIAIEALRDYWHKNKNTGMDEIVKYTKICRVTNVIAPYINSITHG